MAYINKACSGLLIMLVVSVWGCAAQPASSSTDPVAVKAEDTLPRPEPLSTTDVISIQNQTINHNRTLYSVSQGTYTYYMGGILTAVFKESSETLVVTPEDTDGVASCEFSTEGVLNLENVPQNKRETTIKNCNALMKALENSL